MQERDAVVQVASGEFPVAQIHLDNERGGWIITLVSLSQQTEQLETKRGRQVRLFKTSDAALRWCQRMGFAEATVHFPK